MNILHVSAECYPAAKVGGLADVVGALPKYQNRIGHTARVVMPFYKTEYLQRVDGVSVFQHNLVMSNITYFAEVFKVQDADLGYDLFVVRAQGLTDRKEVYGYHDDALRFMAFQRVVLQWVISEKLPDIVHCHDHHTGLIPFMMGHTETFKKLKKTPSILSIHNAQYQGQFPHTLGGILPEFDANDLGLIDWAGMINPLAAAIKCAWRVTTVSPSYMVELQEKANGLEWLLDNEKAKCIGILNGIDAESWDPATDEYLHYNYTTRTRKSGRAKNKAQLCVDFKLDATKPLFGFIGRLVWEKGADVLPEAIERAVQLYDINVILLGSGDPEVENRIKMLANAYPEKFSAYIGYKESMSHHVYSGADFLLMPSRVEPCGLNQLYSLRYGCMPIVRKTGGLKDTVIDIKDGGLGIVHDDTSVSDIVNSIGRAIEVYKNQKVFTNLQKKMMEVDHSWENAARNYESVYSQIKA